jgi:hypothetical protein
MFAGSYRRNIATLAHFDNSYFVSHWFGYSDGVTGELDRIAKANNDASHAQ